MKATQKPFTCKLQIVKVVAKRLQNTKFCAILLVSLILVGIFSLSPAISSLMNDVVIRSTGEISAPPNVTAKSGSAKDIQAAVDWVAASGDGLGNVHIPEGTFNFVEVGEPWMTVNIPAGVNLFGAPTERDVNDQVIEWKTVLVMPWDVPGTWHYGGIAWFRIVGAGDPTKPSRFSDIKLVGYRSIDPSSTTVHGAIKIEDVVDFHVDHCYFEHTCLGVSVLGLYSRGVFDHDFFVNPHGVVGMYMDDCTVFYGVSVGRGYGDYWEDDVSKVLGKYTDYTVFIEDCYFEKWRHCVAANNGAHYVFRHNTIKNDFGYGSLDAHGWGVMEDGVITMVGTRAVEIYENQIVDPVKLILPLQTILIRGGGGVIFNNTITGYELAFYLSQEASDDVPKCQVKDVWIWNNTLSPGTQEISVYYGDKNPIIEGEHYYRHAPHTFAYEPYPYPHPLTLEEKP